MTQANSLTQKYCTFNSQNTKLKRPLFFALLSGILFVISWPVNGFPIFIFGAFVPLFLIEKKFSDTLPSRRFLKLLGYNYLAFAIWNLGTTWWLVNASVFGMVFANFWNSLFFTLLMLAFHWAKQRMPLRSAYLFFVVLWLAFEKFHLSWDFSWPWLNLGHVFSETIQWVQWYEYTGTFGGSLWVLIVNIFLFEKLKNWSLEPRPSQRIQSLIPVLIGIASPIIFSLYLLEREHKSQEELKVALVQPNVDPYDEKYKFSNEEFLWQLENLITIKKMSSIDYILTPETYFAAGYGERLQGFEYSPFYKKLLQFQSQHPNSQLITGIQFYDAYNSDTPPTPYANHVRDQLWVDYYNSALAVSSDTLPQVYHKSKLVVGVENMPYKNFFEPLLGTFLLDLGGTVSSRAIQPERNVFKHPTRQTIAAPIICYESIYGAFVTEYVQKKADFLAILTNDAWWGDTPGHKQLLSLARLRAIENRRAIARAANTGISALISAKGEIISSLPYNKKGVLMVSVPIHKTQTFYNQYGDYLARWAGFLAVLYFFLALSGRLKEKTF